MITGTRFYIPREHIDETVMQQVLSERVYGTGGVEEFFNNSGVNGPDCCGVCQLYMQRIRQPKRRPR